MEIESVMKEREKERRERGHRESMEYQYAYGQVFGVVYVALFAGLAGFCYWLGIR